MIPFYVNPNISDNTTVGASSTQNSLTSMDPTRDYLFVSDCALWLKQGASPTASAADGSMLVPPSQPILLQGRNGAKIAVIQAGASGGNCSLVLISV